jgi:hypothetical protein
MGADAERTIGGEEKGNGGYAGDDTDVEGERAWKRLEKVAEWEAQTVIVLRSYRGLMCKIHVYCGKLLRISYPLSS